MLNWKLYYILSSFNYTSKRCVLIGLSRRISLLVLMTASGENMFLSAKSLHLILIARTKNSPPVSLTSSSDHNTHSFLSFLISLRRNSCAMSRWTEINFIFARCDPARSPATDHTEHLAGSANAAKPSSTQGAWNTHSLLQHSRWAASAVQRGYSVGSRI